MSEERTFLSSSKLFLLVIFLTSLCSAMIVNGQSAANITAAEANTLIQANQGDLGFSAVFFPKDDLNNALRTPGCEGIRFYSYVPGQGQDVSIVAAPIDASGGELGTYMVPNATATANISKEDATQGVEMAKASSSEAIACAFNTSVLRTSMNIQGSDGLHVRPGNSNGLSSFITVGASVDPTGGTSDFGTYFLGNAPCPNVCGGGMLTTLE